MLVLFTFLFAITAASVRDKEMELHFVQTIWRHGDRSPLSTFRTDPFQEDYWKFGGGGFGELSPLGMKQHLDFGKQIRKRYVDTGFLSRRYSSREIYVRSTDRNRTLISAMANMVGMYGQDDKSNIKDVDYPDTPGWPSGYVPIAVHTVKRETDYVGIPHLPCERRDHLWKMAKESDEFKEYLSRPAVVNLLKSLTENCGEEVNEDNVWAVRDTLLIEQIYANESLREKNKWFSDDLFREMSEVDVRMNRYFNGFFDKPAIKDNIDIGLELAKTRGGSMINDLSTRMDMKIDCLNNAHRPECKWISGLKYFIHSAHDSTLSSFLSVMGIHKKVVITGYPGYTAAVFIELWMNSTDNQPYFKLSYRQSDVESNINSVTHHIDGCQGRMYCKVDVFRDIAARTKPDKPMEEWCSVDPRKATSALSSFSSMVFVLIWYICLQS